MKSRSPWLGEGFSVRSFPQPTYFGLRVSFDALQQFGRLILQGFSVTRAAKASGLSIQSAFAFMDRSRLPYRYADRPREPRKLSMEEWASAMRRLDVRARGDAVARFQRDLFRAEYVSKVEQWKSRLP